MLKTACSRLGLSRDLGIKFRFPVWVLVTQFLKYYVVLLRDTEETELLQTAQAPMLVPQPAVPLKEVIHLISGMSSKQSCSQDLNHMTHSTHRVNISVLASILGVPNTQTI